MTDLENVLKGLEQFKSDFKPYVGNKEDWSRIDAAIYFLKEQEAVEPIDLGLSADFITWGCPICKRWLDHDYKYCPYCGKAVKWE